VLGLVKEDANERQTRSGPPSRRPFRGRGDGGRGNIKVRSIVHDLFSFTSIGQGGRGGGAGDHRRGGGGGGGGGGGRGGHQGARGGGRGGQFRQGR
jgi:hypothetical protein